MKNVTYTLILLLSTVALALAVPTVYKAVDGSFQVTADSSFTQKDNSSFSLSLEGSRDHVRVSRKAIPAGRSVGDPSAFLNTPPGWTKKEGAMGTVGGKPAAIVVGTSPEFQQLKLELVMAMMENDGYFYQFQYLYPQSDAAGAKRGKAFLSKVKWTP